MSAELSSSEAAKGTGRIEAFSDGVFAIAITLLALELKIPDVHDIAPGELLNRLAEQWPAYVAFLTSFSVIGIMWINHHRMFTYIKRSDHGLLIFNTLLLLGITIVPFPTSLMAEYIGQPDQNVAAMVFAALSFLIAVFFNLLWRHVAAHPHLLDHRTPQGYVESITRQYRWGPVIYFGCLVVAAFSVALCLALYAGLALYFAVPSEKFVKNSRLSH
jgi:uncharacterized membrane protein